MELRSFRGGCHCGQIRFVVRGDLSTATLCNCSVCSKKGLIHLIVPAADFDLVSGREDLATYEFNTKAAKHHFCRTCGVHPFYVPRSGHQRTVVVAMKRDGEKIPMVNGWSSFWRLRFARI